MIPTDVGGLLLWYKADSITGLNDGDAVSQWNDSSGQNNHAVQNTADNKPIFKTNIVNGLPVVRFDGVDDFMSFTSRVSTIRTAFFVLVWSGLDDIYYPPVLGDSDYYDWHGAYGAAFFSSGYASAYIINGAGYVNGVFTDPAVMQKPHDNFQYISFVTTADVMANRVTRDRGESSYVWRGDYAEIIIYDTALSDVDRQGLEAYLSSKYFSTTGNLFSMGLRRAR